MSLRHPKPAPATPSAGKRAGALPIRCELLLVATLEDAGELVLLACDPPRSEEPNSSQKEADKTVADQVVALSPGPGRGRP
jgi:hypothetical protein